MLELDGETFAEPKDFLSFKRIFAHAHTMRPYFLVQNLGSAIRKGESDRASSLRHIFEESYLPARHSATYQIIARKWNVRRAWIEKDSYKKETLEILYEGRYSN